MAIQDESGRPRSLGSRLLSALGADAPGDLLLLGVSAALVLFGVYWRFARLGYPQHFTFDEHHFVENARNYVLGKPDWNDHPPMAKLVIVPSLLAFGDNGVGWRLPSALLGTLLIGLAFWAARALFSERRAGFLAAAFVAGDGLFISYSRTALPDTPMSAFMLGALVTMLYARGLAGFAAAAVLLGLAVSTKWIAGCLFLVIPWMLRKKGRSPLHALWMLAVVGVVYVGIFWFGLAITHKPASLGIIVQTNLDLLQHHAGFTTWKNPADSRWYTWPFLAKPILLNYDKPGSGGYLHAMSTVGNPVLWYATTLAFLLAIERCARAVWSRLHGEAPLEPTVRQELFVLATAFALIVQWVLTERESYIWHYFGAYYLGLALLASRVSAYATKQPKWALWFVCLAAATSLVYSPVWTEAPLRREQFETLLFMPRWR